MAKRTATKKKSEVSHRVPESIIASRDHQVNHHSCDVVTSRYQRNHFELAGRETSAKYFKNGTISANSFEREEAAQQAAKIWQNKSFTDLLILDGAL